MNYYEKLVKKIDRSMKAHPRSAMVMNLSNFEIIASSPDMKSLSDKVPATKSLSSVVFQKPSQKAAWIL